MNEEFPEQVSHLQALSPPRRTFPNPVLTSVSLYKPFRNRGSLSAGSPTPLSFPICSSTRFDSLAPCPDAPSPRNHQVPQSPFARLRRYLARRDLSCLASEGATAPTGSCARPSSSHLLDSHLVRRVFAGCHQSLLDEDPSRHYLCRSFLGCLAPYLASPQVPLPVSSQRTPVLPPDLTGSVLPPFTRTATSVRKAFSGLQTFLYVQASKFARHPGRSDRHSHRRMAAVTFLP